MKRIYQLLLCCLISIAAVNAFAAETAAQQEIPLEASSVEQQDPLLEWLDDMFTVTGMIALTSNYVSNGVSQTDNDPALQGSLTVLTKYGLYAEVWMSNVNFDNGEGNTAYLESDWYFGYQDSYKGLDYDFGYVRYYYPGSNNLDFGQLYVNLAYSIFLAEIEYSPNASNENVEGVYLLGGVDIPIAPRFALGIEDLSVGGHMAYSLYGGALSGGNYADWEVNLQKKWFSRIVTGIAYTDTNGQGGIENHLDGAKLIGTVTFLFCGKCED